ncbi:acyl-CoA thioesterase [Novosphingobium rosa]|uniref:acyl-CoA thioesterase n=1 Tax=Novosphingobium rosa TaxID=76978 RepID=UPI0008318D4D|nr:thioesterase family protein [Novosphingobium rosa]
MTTSKGSTRDAFKAFVSLTTRWMDNDVYGHVNNVVYYSFFDTAVNQLLVKADLLDVEKSAEIGLVVETGCRYFAPVAFPSAIEIGLRVAHIGTSSVRYELGLFTQGSEFSTAEGHFVHVYVARDTRKSCPIPEKIRSFLKQLTAEG